VTRSGSMGRLAVLAMLAILGGVACKRDVWPGPTPEAASPQAQGPLAAEPVDLAAAPIPAGGHPRLLLTDGRLRMLADGAKRATPPWNALVSACREASGEKIESGYQGEDWAAASLNLALCWRVRHDATYSRPAVTYLMALVDDHEKVGDGEGGVAAVKLDDGYPMRNRGFFASIAYDWLYDALAPEQRKHVADRFVEFVHWYEKDGYKTNDPISNYFLSYFGACAMGGIALEGDDPRGAELRQLALRMWKTQIVPGYAKLPGGDFPEGWQYARVPVESLAFFVETEGRIRGSAAQLTRELPWLGATVDFQNAALQPDGVHTWDNADWSNKPARLAPEMSWAASLALPKDDPRSDEAIFLARLLTKGGAESPRWLAAIADDPARKGVDPRKGHGLRADGLGRRRRVGGHEQRPSVGRPPAPRSGSLRARARRRPHHHGPGRVRLVFDDEPQLDPRGRQPREPALVAQPGGMGQAGVPASLGGLGRNHVRRGGLRGRVRPGRLPGGPSGAVGRSRAA